MFTSGTRQEECWISHLQMALVSSHLICVHNVTTTATLHQAIPAISSTRFDVERPLQNT